MKNLKYKIIVSILVFIAVIVVTVIMTRVSEVKNDSTKGMTSATLPTVSMLTNDGQRYNLLHGYITDVDESGMHDYITVLPEDRKLNIEVDNYGNTITGIKYEVRSLDLEDFIENTNVTGFSSMGSVTSATLNIKNLLEENEEYRLKIILQTESGKDVSYYTRIVLGSDLHVDEKLSYVKHFSEVTYDEEAISEIIPKLETNSSGDNTNLGHVNIHSKLSQIGWGSLKPKVIGKVYPYLVEIEGSTADIRLDYQVITPAVSGFDTYDVQEFFRIKRADENTTYVLSYDRYVDQVFDGDGDLNASGRIYLGVASGLNDYKLSGDSTGRVNCFVTRGELWSYNSKSNEFTRIFSFNNEATGYDTVRETYDQHGIKVMNADSSGNVSFVVYGYMNRGAHEGELGISVCKYTAQDKSVKEILYIPRNESYGIIEKDVDTLCYLNSEDRFFIYQNGYVYSIDTATREYMIVSDSVLMDSAVYSEKYHTFAWQEGEDRFASEAVNILYLSTGETDKVEAASNEYIRTMGTIDGNLILGRMYRSEKTKDAFDRTIYPVYQMEILDGELSCVKKYNVRNVRVTDIDVQEARIIIHRGSFDGGEYVAAPDDELLSRSESTYNLRYISQVATEVRQKENYIILAVDVPASKANVAKASVVFDGGAIIYIQSTIADNNYFAVYGNGKLKCLTTDVSSAVMLADELAGVVVAPNGKKIWTRYKDNSAGKNTDTENLNLELLYDVTGCELDELLYFISDGKFLKVYADDIYLIYGYDASNIYALVSGEGKVVGRGDMSNIVSSAGKIQCLSRKN